MSSMDKAAVEPLSYLPDSYVNNSTLCPHHRISWFFPVIFGRTKWSGCYRKRLSFMLLKQLRYNDIKISWNILLINELNLEYTD